MNIKFTGDFQDLKKKLELLGGDWDDSQQGKKVLRVNGGVLNWFETTGTLQIQGKSPGRDQLENNVPHFLYPDEFKQITAPVIEQKEDASTPTVSSATPSITIEHLYLSNNYKNTELVIGIVNAVGTEYKRVLDPLSDRLRGFGYDVKEIRVSALLTTCKEQGEYERVRHLMGQGDELRGKSRNNAILAAGASHKIKEARQGEPTKTAYIINSLKHPDEVEFLRRVYGDGFYLFGIHADEKRRHDYLVKDKSLTQEQASELIFIDEDEKIDNGQRTRDTFHLSDFFINLDKNDDQVKNTIQRFLELLFSNPYRNPTFDEFAMFMAFNSSIRSSDLSRQVGAILARNQQIVATGANDCPKYGGGQYWAEVDTSTGEVKDIPGGKDYTREVDSNKAAQNEMIAEIAKSLVGASVATDLKEVEKVLQKSKISDLTEFGRVVHAEMEAILSCAREGIPTTGTTLYCTTFPCHNCAKHIIDAGITRVVYVEPYPKSRALDLHSESIELKTSLDSTPDKKYVIFEPFTGVGTRRFLDLFSMSLGGGIKVKRKDKASGDTIDWVNKTAIARTPLLPKSYLDVENAASDIWKKSRPTP